MKVYPINCSYIQAKPRNRRIYFAANSSTNNDSLSLNTNIDARIKEFKEKGDLEGYAKFLNSEQFPHQKENVDRGQYIADYFELLRKQARFQLGAEISIEYPNVPDKYARFFSDKNPEAFNYIYETISKYKTIANIKEQSLGKESVYPKHIQIKSIDEYMGSTNQFGTITLDPNLLTTKTFSINSNAISLFEHEIGHLKDDKKNYFKPFFTYLNILTPEERKLYSKFENIYREKSKAKIEETPLAEFISPDSFHFPNCYNNKNETLISLDCNFNRLTRFNKFLNSKQKFSQNLLDKMSKIVERLSKFSDDVSAQISEPAYYRSTPAETKAQAFSKRASGMPVSPDYMLPITEELEEQLAKLGMPEPETYTILPKNHPVRKVAGFGEELVKRLSPELLAKIKR